jgi:hypothetical protein
MRAVGAARLSPRKRPRWGPAGAEVPHGTTSLSFSSVKEGRTVFTTVSMSAGNP